MSYLDFMVDLETLGLGNEPVIIQIGCTHFDIETGKIISSFESLVDPSSCVEKGLKVDGSTVEWWLKQDKNVQSKVLVDSLRDGKKLIEVLLDLWVYISESQVNQENKEIRVWSNGLLADVKWLESAHTKCGLKTPWKYNQVSDVRTIVDLAWRKAKINVKDLIQFEGEQHNAIDDCKYQVQFVHKAYTVLMNQY